MREFNAIKLYFASVLCLLSILLYLLSSHRINKPLFKCTELCVKYENEQVQHILNQIREARYQAWWDDNSEE